MDLQNVFLTLWNMSLTGSMIIGFVLLARLLLRKAPKVFSYVLWSVVLFRLLCPVSVSSMFSVLNFTKAAESVSESVVTTMDYSVVMMPEFIPAGENEPVINEPVMIEPEFNEPDFKTPVIPVDGMESMEVPDAALPQAPAEPVRNPIHYAVTIWLVGLGVMLIYNVISCIRLFRQIEGAVPLRKELYLADYIPTAFVLGIVNPKIYLPSYLSPEERGYIIAHERCHIKRMDHVFRLLAYLALCLHWFNPLVWLAFVLSGKDMEMSCDEAVIRMYGPRIRAEYSQSLLRLATGHRSFALTPLAFGEGDTKERVINMTKWKKPRLWAVVFALVACIAVLVACATNPESEVPTVESTEEATEVAEKKVYWDTEADAVQACADAIQKLIDSESYTIVNELELGENSQTTEYRKHGEDYLVQCSDWFFANRVFVDGKGAYFHGDYWVWGGLLSSIGPDEWLYRWSPDFVETSNISTSQNTVSFDAQWAEEPSSIYKDRHYKGTLTYTFNPDGRLQSILREYIAMDGEEVVSGTVETMRPIEEAPEDIHAAILAIAEQCIPEEELEQKRQEKQTVSEIPSNKTDFDKNYELGSAQMRWYFFGKDWQFAFGAEDATPTSAVLFHTESNDGHKSLVAEETFWLEKLVDGTWQYLDESKKEVSAEKQSVKVAWNAKDSYLIDWSDSYGALEPGFYRLGRYYTVTMESGETETRPCYAKFRVMGENWEELLTRCEDALEELQNRETYYLIFENNLTEHADPDEPGYLPWIITSHIYKNGEDYLEDVQYHDRANYDLWLGRRGSMLRDGQNYSLEWTGREVDTPLSAWSRLDYSTTYDMWVRIFEWYDSSIVDVTEIGCEISILMELGEYGHGNKYRELRFRFNNDGTIFEIYNLYHPSEGITKMRDKTQEDILFVMDTSEVNIPKLIESQEVSKPIQFTYQMDVEDYPDAQMSGFVNTAARKIRNMEDAISLAKKECTMKKREGQDVPYNITEVYYDATAKIWKVVLRYSQNIEGDQAIYLNEDGITQMKVTYTEENDPDNAD